MNSLRKTFIIAEVGSNHNGSLETAKELIDVAAVAGADAVKFQLIPPFERDWIDQLLPYCQDQEIEFMATPFNQTGIDALKGKVKHWKIASTEGADPDFVAAVLAAAKGDPIFLSDGAVSEFPDLPPNVIPLQCVVEYPAKERDYTLGLYLHRQGPWGLSDHTLGVNLSRLAVVAGASVIEKHITLDNFQLGPDHYYAVTPTEFHSFVYELRKVEWLFHQNKTTVTTYVGRKLEWS